MLFKDLSKTSPEVIISRTWESLRDTHENLFENSRFDEFILALRESIKNGDITEALLDDLRLQHIAANKMSAEYPFLYACILNELAQQALSSGDHNRSWPLITHASASAEGAATHAFYSTVIDTTAALNHRRAMAGANARNAKFQKVKDYALTLMIEKRPKHGWDDFMHAAESIKNELGNFIDMKKIGLRKELITKTLRRWRKDDEIFRRAIAEIIPSLKQ
ncbi:hypothetical protein CQ065_16615 [Pseudomonas sp. MYb187]|uniref:hypothetical protein n=1 Tax=Pseudomonas TaxID=286 RepID=UPI000CFDAE55|nr:hypothetical protein [Pseudomonas sp. MYb187]PRA61890.1 hypothetical protein CQ065_16615 [Pseudomonas sp. MYb187]